VLPSAFPQEEDRSILKSVPFTVCTQGNTKGIIRGIANSQAESKGLTLGTIETPSYCNRKSLWVRQSRNLLIKTFKKVVIAIKASHPLPDFLFRTRRFPVVVDAAITRPAAVSSPGASSLAASSAAASSPGDEAAAGRVMAASTTTGKRRVLLVH
jgi:hypothetical protein